MSQLLEPQKAEEINVKIIRTAQEFLQYTLKKLPGCKLDVTQVFESGFRCTWKTTYKTIKSLFVICKSDGNGSYTWKPSPRQ